MAFYVIYVLEAHSSDGWSLAGNVVLASPRNYAEREEAAGACIRKLNLHIPALVDNFDNAAEAAYKGWPDRLYVIGRDGRVEYKSAAGPWGFIPRRVAVELERLAGPPAS